MNTKTFDDDEDTPVSQRLPIGAKNYMTPAGYAAMQAEFKYLVEVDRPQVVQTVSWAASNGDRSENGDYLYGKRRLREIDRRLRYLTKRIENAEVVNHHLQDHSRVFFGATVVYARPDGSEHTITIVGADEIDPAKGYVSWFSPIARALNKAQVGDEVLLATPAGKEWLDVLEITYADLPQEAGKFV